MPGGGRFIATNAPLRELVRVAYDIPDFLLVDAPDWMRTERFDIVAKAEGSLMVRSLIETGSVSSAGRRVRCRWRGAAHGKTRP
jgi:uncharacterized protein (TIGR03435 family)